MSIKDTAFQHINVNRRKFIIGGGLLTTSTLLSTDLFTKVLASEAISSVRGSVIYRDDNPQSIEFASIFDKAGHPLVKLSLDPVRQWRDELESLLQSNEQPLIGLTNWSDYLIMKGLTADLRRYPRQTLQHQVDQHPENLWVRERADELLKLSTNFTQDIPTLPSHDIQQKTNGKSLFSWIII